MRIEQCRYPGRGLGRAKRSAPGGGGEEDQAFDPKVGDLVGYYPYGQHGGVIARSIGRLTDIFTCQAGHLIYCVHDQKMEWTLVRASLFDPEILAKGALVS